MGVSAYARINCYLLISFVVETGQIWNSMASLWCDYLLEKAAMELDARNPPVRDWDQYFRSIEACASTPPDGPQTDKPAQPDDSAVSSPNRLSSPPKTPTDVVPATPPTQNPDSGLDPSVPPPPRLPVPSQAGASMAPSYGTCAAMRARNRRRLIPVATAGQVFRGASLQRDLGNRFGFNTRLIVGAGEPRLRPAGLGTSRETARPWRLILGSA